MAGYQRSAGRRAGWSNVVVIEPHGFSRQLVEVRGFHDRVAVNGEIAIALVIGDDEDDVGFVLRRRDLGSDHCNKGEKCTFHIVDGDCRFHQ